MNRSDAWETLADLLDQLVHAGAFLCVHPLAVGQFFGAQRFAAGLLGLDHFRVASEGR